MLNAYNADYSWDAFTNAVPKYLPVTNFSAGVVLDATGDVPVSDERRTIDFLRRRGQRHFLLFGTLECVDSPAMTWERRQKEQVKEVMDESNKPFQDSVVPPHPER